MPHYQMMLGGTQHEFGVADYERPGEARSGGRQARAGALQGASPTRRNVPRNTCCGTKWRRSDSSLADLAKPPADVPEMFRDWGDDMEYSLKLGRGECAA